MTDLLTPEELEDYTHLKQSAAQSRWLRDIRAKYGTDHEDGRKALRHSSEAVFEKHYNRKGATVKPLK